MKSSREVREAATLAERSRIIKLLEVCPKDEQWHLDNLMCCEGRCDFAIQDYQDSLIALIKGENK